MSKDFTPGRPLRVYGKNKVYKDYSTETLVGEKLNYFQGWLCGMGVENIFIDSSGNTFGANCRQDGSLGNIFEKIKIPRNWRVCEKVLCRCGGDLFIPKARDAQALPRLVKTAGGTLSEHTQKDFPLDEFVAMERVHDADLKQIHWELLRRCNYSCNYCPPSLHNKTEIYKNFDQLIRATLLLDEQFAQGANAHFIITGGEPTINPALLDWVKFIKSLGHTVSMHSNGSRQPGYYQELIQYTHLNLSLHFEFYKSERFLAVIAAVLAEKIRVKNKNVGHLEVKIMMPPGFMAQALEVEQKIFQLPQFSSYCTLAIVPIRDGDNGDLLQEGYKNDDFKLFGDRQN